MGLLRLVYCPPGFQVKLGLVRGRYLPAGLHAVVASYVSASSQCAFRAALVRSVWSSKMPLANTLVVLNLLDGLVGVGPALHIVWTKFLLMRRFLAHRPMEVPSIFRMLDLIACGSPGHGLVHICFVLLLLRLGLPAMESNKVGLVLPSSP